MTDFQYDLMIMRKRLAHYWATL